MIIHKALYYRHKLSGVFYPIYQSYSSLHSFLIKRQSSGNATSDDMNDFYHLRDTMKARKTGLLALSIMMVLMPPADMHAVAVDSVRVERSCVDTVQPYADSLRFETAVKHMPVSPYALPYSMTGNSCDWHRLWVNTATLSSAFVGTLLFLECLPEDATAWNRAELQDVPLFKRWHNHVIKEGPEWDHDLFIFNYVLHPYAGAVYFMGARSCGFNFWRSALYSTIVSTVGWEFGIEAFMERPSVQDIFVTPIVGSCIGEGFYRVKRWLVDNDYRLFGSPVLGGILAFLVDPVNEFTGLWLGNPARAVAHNRADMPQGGGLTLAPAIIPGYKGFSLTGYF